MLLHKAEKKGRIKLLNSDVCLLDNDEDASCYSKGNDCFVVFCMCVFERVEFIFILKIKTPFSQFNFFLSFFSSGPATTVVREHCFKITTKKGIKYILQAPSEEERKDWIKRLSSIINKYPS